MRLDVYSRHKRRDPTLTTTLRNRFSGEMYKRFRELKGVIRRGVVDRDALGLKEDVAVQQAEPPAREAFAFERDPQKVEQFMEWLREQQQRGVLEVRARPQLGRGAEEPWTNLYIQSAYRQGVQRAREELRRGGGPPAGTAAAAGATGAAAAGGIPTIEESGGIDVVMNQPFHADRVGLLYTRAFNELKGITETMDQQISRVLAQGLADGLNPREMANALNDRVDGIGIHRARILARTEVIRAHHSAMMQEYRNWKQEGVQVKAEFVTAGDSRVCPACKSLEGQVFDLDTAETLIPVHASCRCVALPVDLEAEDPSVGEPPDTEAEPDFGG